MKKILAIAMALMLLCLPMAMAEEATKTTAVMGLSNIEMMGMNLGELQLWLGVDAKDGVKLSLEAAVGEDSLLSAAGELDGNQLKVKFNDEDVAYALDLSQAGDSLEQLPSMLQQMIPALDQFELPPVPAVSLPKLDASILTTMFGGEGQDFAISTEIVDSLIDMASQYADTITNVAPQAKAIVDMLPQLKGKLAFDGTVADEGDAQVTRVNLQYSGEALLTLVFTTQENAASLVVESDGSEMGGMKLTTDAASDTIDLTLNAMGSDIANVDLFKEDGLQNVEINVTAAETIGMGFAYGKANDVDVVEANLDAGESGSLLFELNTAKDDDGTRSGTVEFASDINHSEMNLSADVIMYLDSMEIGEITWPDTLQSFDQLDVDALLAPVGEYLGTLEEAA